MLRRLYHNPAPPWAFDRTSCPGGDDRAQVKLRLTGNPRHDEIDDLRLPRLGERDAQRTLPPLVETAPAAGRRRMLGDEHGMAAHRGLPSVVFRMRGSEAKTHKVLRMSANRLHPLFRDIAPQVVGQAKPPTKRRSGQPRKRLVVCHGKVDPEGSSPVISSRQGASFRRRQSRRCRQTASCCS